MLSIRPKWCELIASGQKTIEVRKTKPKCNVPFKVYIYCTEDFRTSTKNRNHKFWIGEPINGVSEGRYLGNGKVIGEFVCDRIYELVTYSQGGSYYVKGEDQSITNDVARHSCLTLKDMHEYLRSNVGYGWHISDLIIYDEPKDLSDFYKPCIYGEESDVSCFLCDKSGYRPDMYIDCFNKVTRPPQSWCYVEKERESNDE